MVVFPVGNLELELCRLFVARVFNFAHYVAYGKIRRLYESRYSRAQYVVAAFGKVAVTDGAHARYSAVPIEQRDGYHTIASIFMRV